MTVETLVSKEFSVCMTWDRLIW